MAKHIVHPDPLCRLIEDLPNLTDDELERLKFQADNNRTYADQIIDEYTVQEREEHWNQVFYTCNLELIKRYQGDAWSIAKAIRYPQIGL